MCSQCLLDKPTKYKNSTCASCYKKQNYQSNKEKITSRRMDRYRANKQKEFEYQYSRKRKDSSYRALCCVRTRVWRLLKDPTYKYSTSVGCTQEEFMKHIESQFLSGMTWDNYGNRAGQWNIDHIFPLSKALSLGKEEFKKACHYSNLRPMWSIENRSKGNKICSE